MNMTTPEPVRVDYATDRRPYPGLLNVSFDVPEYASAIEWTAKLGVTPEA
jgi:hypothetical protein